MMNAAATTISTRQTPGSGCRLAVAKASPNVVRNGRAAVLDHHADPGDLTLPSAALSEPVPVVVGRATEMAMSCCRSVREQCAGDGSGTRLQLGVVLVDYQPVDPERREAVDDRPGSHGGGAGIGSDLLAAQRLEATREDGFGPLLGGDEVWVVVTVEVGSEHDLEVGAVHDCGSHVGHADLDEVARRVEGSAELVGEVSPSLRRQAR